ncbi:MAG: flagellar hook-length control protein FliK, partial [Gammaproteobacteria bacterium]|nr:flagellar hook-length control protein FliK [Gammaproteobacteria bacterium]
HKIVGTASDDRRNSASGQVTEKNTSRTSEVTRGDTDDNDTATDVKSESTDTPSQSKIDTSVAIDSSKEENKDAEDAVSALIKLMEQSKQLTLDETAIPVPPISENTAEGNTQDNIQIGESPSEKMSDLLTVATNNNRVAQPIAANTMQMESTAGQFSTDSGIVADARKDAVNMRSTTAKPTTNTVGAPGEHLGGEANLLIDATEQNTPLISAANDTEIVVNPASTPTNGIDTDTHASNIVTKVAPPLQGTLAQPALPALDAAVALTAKADAEKRLSVNENMLSIEARATGALSNVGNTVDNSAQGGTGNAGPSQGVYSPHATSHTGPSGASTQASVSTMVGRPGWGEHFGERVHWMANNQVQSADIQLNPAHLGPVRVQIEYKGDDLNVVISTPHSAVREAVEASLPKLRELLSDSSGSRPGNIDVTLQDFQQRQGSSLSDGSAYRSQHNHRFYVESSEVGVESNPRPTLPAKQGLLDMYA